MKNLSSGNLVPLLLDSVARQSFPGCQYSVLHGGHCTTNAAGTYTYETDAPAITSSTLFDIASLTKPIAGVSMAMLLWDDGRLDFDAPVVSVLPEFAGHTDARRAQVTFRMLLAHSSGLPAYIRLFETAATKEDLLAQAFQVPLETEPMSRAEYSDVGFILLGTALERIAGEPIDCFVRRRIFEPLGMRDTMFNPPSELRQRCAPTDSGNDFRHRLIQGEVHDENCYVLNGVSAHAGLFSTADDIAKFAACMLRGGDPIFNPDTVRKFTRRDTMPPYTTRTLGWDTPSQPSSSGRYFSPYSYGHLGFTGTSLWIDPEADLAIVLLTNRVWPDRSSQLMKQFRPAFHDAVREELGLVCDR
jgi:serine-type D-Ala-D-Ala carboxypeptidase